MFEVYVDGGCIVGKNFGAASLAIVTDVGIVKIQSLSIAGTPDSGLTNNGAEFTALMLGLREIAGCDPKATGEITVYSDSELIVKQISGEYKTNDQTLKELKSSVHYILGLLEASGHKITIKNVPRENKYITVVDKLNKVIMGGRKND